MFKIGDKVRVKAGMSVLVEIGEVGVIKGVDNRTYAVEFDNHNPYKHDCCGLCKNGHGWNCTEEMLELALPTLAQIKEERLTCVIQVKSSEEVVALGSYFGEGIKRVNQYWRMLNPSVSGGYDGTVCFSVREGCIMGYCSRTFYESRSEKYGTIYEFSDLCADSVRVSVERIASITDTSCESVMDALNKLIKKMEEKKMPTKFTFHTEEGYRIDKSNNSKVETITTFVKINGFDNTYLGMATCDKVDYSERDGILNAIANAVLGGNFDREYEKFLADKKRKYDESCKCKICGRNYYEDEKTGKRTPFTPEDARKHEEWHEQNRKNKREKYLIRKEAKRRLAEAEREGKIEKVMKELYKK